MKIRSVSRVRAARLALPSFQPVALAVAVALAAPRMVCAGPGGATVVGGQAQVTQPDPHTTVIRQDSDKAIINWRSFSIGSGQSVQFQQPGSNSVALNRVTTATPSEIHGTLSANGKVFLVNPSGILFGQGAAVDVGSLVASTLDIRDDDFLAGRYLFSGGGDSGSVRNEGRLSAAEHGTVALLGAQVSNQGTIAARLGTVGLAAGGKVSLDFAGEGLTRIVVDAAHINALVENGGLLLSDGGQVVMTAHALEALAGTVVNNRGTVRARSLVERNGRIVLDGGAVGNVELAGTLDASGVASGLHGGAITVQGQNVGLAAGSDLDARGDSGGGTVLVGGDERGANPAFKHAAALSMDAGATIRVDALGSGDGGKVVLWSDGPLSVHGVLGARGGAQAGNGGLIETSGRTVDIAGLGANASAPKGKAGTWLLAPDDVTIGDEEAATISDVLSNGTNSTTASTGSITLSGSILKSAPAAATGVATDATLTLNAAQDIIMYGGPAIRSTSGKLHVDFNANANGKVSPGANETRGVGVIRISSGSVIETNGGDIRLYGQGDPDNGSAIGHIGRREGIRVDNAELDTCAAGCVTGGAISMRGQGIGGTGPDSDYLPYGARGIVLTEPTLRSGPGNITISGQGGMGSLEYGDARFDSGRGVELYLLDIDYGGNISTTTGDIRIGGTDGAALVPAGTSPAVRPYGASGVYAQIVGNGRIATTGGDIVVRGDSYADTGPESESSAGVDLRMSGAVSAGGSLKITGIARGDAWEGVRIRGNFQPDGESPPSTVVSSLSAGGEGVLLAGRSNAGVGLSLADVTVTTTGGAQLVVAGESAGSIGVLLADAVLGAPAMRGDIVLRAASGAPSASMLQVDDEANASIGTSGTVAISPGGVSDTGTLTTRPDIPIAIGASGETGFYVSFEELGLAGTAPKRVVVGSKEHRAKITIDDSAQFVGDLSLQNDGGNGGIELRSAINVSGQLTLSSGGTVAAADLEYGGPVISASSLLLHGAAPESNFQLASVRNQVNRFAATFDTAKSTSSPDHGDVNFSNTGALTLGSLAGRGYSSAENAVTTISAPNTIVAGDVLVNTSGDLRLGQNLSTLGSDITLVTGGLFLNPDSNLLLPGGGGSWRVFADTWVGEVRGSLAPSRPFPNYYGCTYNGAGCPASVAGNHFFYRTRPTLTLSPDSATREYGDADPLLSYSSAGLVNGDTFADAASGSYASTASLRSSPGSYATSGTFSSPVGYQVVALPGSLAVTPATILVSMDSKRKTYGAAEPPLSASLTGFKLDDTAAVVSGLSLSTATGADATAGFHPIVGAEALAANYRFVYQPGILTVDPAPLRVNIANASKTYGDADPVPSASFSGFQYDDNAGVVSGLVLSTVTGPAATAGSHPITGAGGRAANYTLGYQPGTLTVEKAPLLVIAADKSKVYGDPDPLLNASVSGLKYSDTAAVVDGLSLAAPAGADATAGVHAITVANGRADNYTLAYRSGTLAVAKAALTIVADNKVKVYGAPEPALTATMTGLKYGDTASAVSGLTLSTANGALAGVGSHPITASNAGAVNYTPAFVPGVLQVEPAVLSYVATPVVQFQNLPPRSLEGTVTGFAYNDTSANATTGTLAFSSDATLQSLPGAYAVQGSGLTAANYRFVQASSNDTALTVLPSPELLRPSILRNVSFESSNIYEKNFGTPRLCVGTGPLGVGAAGGDANDALALEWSRVRVSPNLSNCLGLGQRNSCSDF